MQNKKYSICFSTYDDIKNPYYGGGGAIAISQITKRLAKKYKVTVITGKYPNSKNEVLDGVTYERVGTEYFGGKVGQVVFQFCLPFLVMTKSYDIWMESFTPPFSTTCLQLFTKKPVVGIVHMLSGEDMKRKYRLPFDSIEKIGLKTYKHIIVLSEAMKKKLMKINPSVDSIVIPNGVDTSAKKIINASDKKKKKYILFIGRIEVDQKGLDLLLTSYASIAKTINYPLFIAGSGEKKEEVKVTNLINSLKLSKDVVLLGRVSSEMKEKIYSEAVCVVSSSRFETFPLVALESLSYGIPFISFAIDGYSWVPDTVIQKVKPFSATQFAKAIEYIVKDREKADTMIRSGKEFVKKFSWDTVAQSYDTYLSALL